MSYSGMSEHHVLSQLTLSVCVCVCVCVFTLIPHWSLVWWHKLLSSLLSVVFNLWVKNIFVQNVGTQCVHVFCIARSHFRIFREHSDHQDQHGNSDLPFTFSKAWGNHYSLCFFFSWFSCLPLPCPSSIDHDHNNRKCAQNDFPFPWSLISPVYWLDAPDIISHF